MPVFITQPMIQFFALGFTVLSAFFFAREVLIASPKTLSELAKSKLNYNLDVVKTVSRQKADALFGFLFLIISVLFQGINLLFPARWIDFEGLTFGTIIVLIFILSIIFLVSLKINNKYKKNTEKEILNELRVEK